MPIYLIRHVTSYHYGAPVAFGEHRLLVRSRDGFDQRTLDATIEVLPQPGRLSWSEDPSGNLVGTVGFDRRARELRFASTLKVEQTVLDVGALRLSEHARLCPFSYGAEEFPDLARFIARQHPDQGHVVDAWARRILEEDTRRDGLAFLRRLTGTIRRDFAYLRREEHGIQAPVATLRLARGSCRDFAVLMMEAVKAVGFAARFVSGYLYVRPDESGLNVARGSMHAWLQVYLPGAGWVDFDPTSGGVGNEGLIRTAIVADPDQATPLSGSFMGFPSDYLGMKVSVSVSRVAERVPALPERRESRAG